MEQIVASLLFYESYSICDFFDLLCGGVAWNYAPVFRLYWRLRLKEKKGGTAFSNCFILAKERRCAKGIYKRKQQIQHLRKREVDCSNNSECFAAHKCIASILHKWPIHGYMQLLPIRRDVLSNHRHNWVLASFFRAGAGAGISSWEFLWCVEVNFNRVCCAFSPDTRTRFDFIVMPEAFLSCRAFGEKSAELFVCFPMIMLLSW